MFIHALRNTACKALLVMELLATLLVILSWTSVDAGDIINLYWEMVVKNKRNYSITDDLA